MRPYRSNPTRVALRHIRSIADSAMQAQLYGCSDGHSYVLKLPGNNQGNRCIANDFIATHLAKGLGLPVISSSFVHVVPELLPDRDRYPHTANLQGGTAWGTRFQAEFSEPKTKKDVRNLNKAHLIPWVIAFDHWILNWDRCDKMANLLLTKGDGMRDWYLIDHGIAFATPKFVEGHIEWNLDRLQRYQSFHDYSFRGALYDAFVPYVQGKDPFHQAIKQIRKIREQDILDLMKQMPSSWNITADDKTAFAAALVTRAAHLPDILRHSKDYYPGWK